MQSNKSKYNTLVFFDLETTDLPSKKVPTRITELSLLAVERFQFLACKPKEIPRVSNKLNLCVNPTSSINLYASKLTGLDNNNLEQQSPFDDETANIVLGFLKRLKGPICLIAHNGDKFDFPLLKSEIERLGKKLPLEMLCADSIPILKELDSDLASDTNSLTENKSIDEINNDTSLHPTNEAPRKRRVDNQPTGNQEKKSRIFRRIPQKSYKLEEVYKRIFNEQPEEAHHAEADVKMLMFVVANYSQNFLDKLDIRAQPLANITKFW